MGRLLPFALLAGVGVVIAAAEQGAARGHHVRAQHDAPGADELELWAENASKLYSQKESILRNLLRKMRRGTYDSAKAVAAWQYWADEAARDYAREFGGTWHKMFPIEDRRAAARSMRDRHESALRNGEWDELVPKRGRG